MSDDKTTPLRGGLTVEQLIELRDTNPGVYAKHCNLYGVSAPPSAHDKAMRGVTEPPKPAAIDTTGEADERLRTYSELLRSNPIIAARYAIANSLFEK